MNKKECMALLPLNSKSLYDTHLGMTIDSGWSGYTMITDQRNKSFILIL